MRASAIWNTCRRLIADPPPANIFEISGRGIAAVHRNGGAPDLKYAELGEGVLTVTPLHDNITNQDAFQTAVSSLAGAPSARKRQAALLLPDFSSRISVLDFQTFPGAAAEQAMLIRFRLKKTVPFDIDAAALSYHVQHPSADGRVDVVTALMPLEILARYEAPFRAAGFQLGTVTPSLLGSLRLVKPGGIVVLAKLSGRVMTVAVLQESALRLVRCVELENVAEPEVSSVLLPTFVYGEDKRGRPANRLLWCGFGPRGEAWSENWGIPAETLGSRYGAPGEANAGLLGFLEGEAA